VSVVDGINAAMTLCGYDLQSNTDATLFGTLLLRPLANTGSCVIAVDHVPKNPDGRLKGGIGAQAKRAMMSGCQLVADVAEPFGVGQDGMIKLTVDKDRSGMVRGNSAGGKFAGRAIVKSTTTTVRIHIVAPSLEPREDPNNQTEWAPTIVMEKISILLEGLTEPCSYNAIEKAKGGAKKETIRKAVDMLHSRGYIEITSGPRNSLLHRSVKPYRADDPPPSPTVPRPSPGDGEETVPTVPPGTLPYGSPGTGDSHGSEVVDNLDDHPPGALTLPDEHSHCNRCGELAPQDEIDTNAGFCNSCAVDGE
jgi:hypothetical protein